MFNIFLIDEIRDTIKQMFALTCIFIGEKNLVNNWKYQFGWIRQQGTTKKFSGKYDEYLLRLIKWFGPRGIL